MKNVTKDALFNDRIIVTQPASGYRFSMDAVIVANTALLRPPGRVCDIGTGCGIIPLVMAYRNAKIETIYGIEIQGSLSAIAIENVMQNRLDDRIKIIHKDINLVTVDDLNGPVDLVVANPPHHVKNAARINPLSEKALARHEITLTMDHLLSSAARLLAPSGRLIMIYPAARLAPLLAGMKNRQIAPRILRFVHTSPEKNASRVVVEGVKGGGEDLKIVGPLFITDEKGKYTPELDAMFAK